MDKRKLTITVDGKAVDCEPGELLIAAAERAGVYIPRFCWHPRMDPVGACRMCVVNVQPGPPKPQAACTTRVADGMVVETQFTNADVRKAQQGVLEFLLINHPLDCPICDRGGECPLQDQTLDYGAPESRFLEPKRRFTKPVEISSLIKLDRERCILCYRCTRFCEELSGDTLIGVMQRGPEAYIYPFEGDAFDSYFSGNTVQICPVGALTSSTYRFEARPWDLRLTPTTCNLCASGCAITADVRFADGRLVRVSSRVNEDVNEEWLCDKGRYGHAYVSVSQRLLQPLVRQNGELVPTSWQEALRLITERIGLVSTAGDVPRAGVIVGGSLCDEDAYTAQKFARLVLHTNSVDCRLEGGMSAGALVPPSVGYRDLLEADRVVLVSCDLREELPLVFLRLRVAASRGRVAVSAVHPRRIDIAGQQLFPLPGTEALVGAAVAAALGRPIAAGAEALAASAGVPSPELRSLADAMRDSQRCVILLGPHVASDPEAVFAWKAVAGAANARLGWAPRRAGEYGALAAGAHPDLLPGWRPLADDEVRSEIEQTWGSPLPATPGRNVAGMLAQARDGDLELLWLVGADVLRDVPDAILGAQALEGARFCVVQDVQRSDQDRFADLILPAASFAERDGTLTNWEGRRQPVTAAVDPAGAARADYAILAEVARRVGTPIGCRKIADARGELESLLREPPVPAADGQFRASAPGTDAEYPLRLLTYRLLYDDGSRVRHTPEIQRLTPQPFVELHPQSGIADGATVVVRSRYGSAQGAARITDWIRPGVAFVPYLHARELLSIEERTPSVRVEPA